MVMNIYQPDLMKVLQVRRHTGDVKSVRIAFQDSARADDFSFRVGQFGIFSAFGYGESTFNICSSSNWKDSIEFCFRKTGAVTEALWQIEEGDTIGFRGPYGTSYPMENWQGRDLIFIGGGIAMPPIRCAIWYALENREKYGRITIVYGARTVHDLVFREELDEWARHERTTVIRCVDPGGETPDWTGEIGFVPTVLKNAAEKETGLFCRNDPSDTSHRLNPAPFPPIALVIGPPIMIKNTLPVLVGMGLSDRDIYTSLENRMKCGVGKCGRCNCGPLYICKEGPVFSLEQIKRMPNDF